MFGPCHMTALAATAAAGAWPVMACSVSPAFENLTFDVVERGPHCSFVMRANETFGYIDGQPAADIGGNRIRQVVRHTKGCSYSEFLFVADCTAGRWVAVDGDYHPDVSTMSTEGPSIDVAAILPPYGVLELNEGSTLDSIRDVAQKAGYSVHSDADTLRPKIVAEYRYDPLCACATYYPETAGEDN